MRLGLMLLLAASAWAGENCSSVPLMPSLGPQFQGDQKYKDLYGNRVFRLYSDLSSDDAAQATGFLIDAQLPFVLTVAHLIPQATFPKSDTIVGQLALFPDLVFHFSVERSFCEQIFQEECKDDAGNRTKGMDVAVLRMLKEDFQLYQNTVGGSAPFVVMLGPNPPAIVYSLGFQGQGRDIVGTSAPRLDGLTSTVTADTTFAQPTSSGDADDFIWRLSNPVLGGRSGSPLFDADGRVFGMITREDVSNLNQGLALNLAGVTKHLEDLRFIFDALPLRTTASGLKTKILGHLYKSDTQIGHDLRPALVTNNELISVAFGIQPVAASYEFKTCVDSAIVSRNLSSLFDLLYPKGTALSPQVTAVVQQQKATGLQARGRLQEAATVYADAYQRAAGDPSANRDARVEMTAALGAAKAYKQIDDSRMATVYSSLALSKANAESNKGGPQPYLREFAALASSYLFELAGQGTVGLKRAVTYAQAAFQQAPAPVFDLYSTVPEKEHFRINSAKLPAGQWSQPIAAIKTALEQKLLGASGQN